MQPTANDEEALTLLLCQLLNENKGKEANGVNAHNIVAPMYKAAPPTRDYSSLEGTRPIPAIPPSLPPQKHTGAQCRVRVRCGRDLTADLLRGLIGKFGVIRQLHMGVDRSTGTFSGCAGATMSSDEEVNTLVDQLHGTVYHGHMVYIENVSAKMQFQHSEPNWPAGSRLFVRFPPGTTDIDVHSLFAVFGTIEYVVPIIDKLWGREPSSAFVKFYSAENARASLEYVSQKHPGGMSASMAADHVASAANAVERTGPRADEREEQPVPSQINIAELPDHIRQKVSDILRQAADENE